MWCIIKEKRVISLKDKITTILISGFVIIYYAIYFGLVVALLPGIWKIIVGILPLALIYGMVKVSQERLEEIEGGEYDDLSKY